MVDKVAWKHSLRKGLSREVGYGTSRKVDFHKHIYNIPDTTYKFQILGLPDLFFVFDCVASNACDKRQQWGDADPCKLVAVLISTLHYLIQRSDIPQDPFRTRLTEGSQTFTYRHRMTRKWQRQPFPRYLLTKTK